MPTLNDIHAWLEDKAGHALHGDEGVMFGDPDRPVTGVAVCWMPSPRNVRAAADAGHELLIHHEALLYPYPLENQQPLSAMHWPTNHQRLRALGQLDLVASRLHGTIDELWIFDAVAEQLGLSRVHASGEGLYERVFEIEPTPYGDLIEKVKQAMGMGGVRATSVKSDRMVTRVGMPWGGMALLANVGYLQSLIELAPDVDVMIAGETDNYGFRFCTELGIDVIETSHELSEHKGLGRFADALRQQFPELSVGHVADECVWRMR
jgi:putative NIF3 family GTP cyclohydrolase 1 type 2